MKKYISLLCNALFFCTAVSSANSLKNCVYFFNTIKSHIKQVSGLKQHALAEGFLAGTKIVTSIGPRTINDLKQEDVVVSCDHDNSLYAKPVTHIHAHRVQEYIKISTQEEEINTAPDQRFLTLQKQLLFNRKVWVAAKHLTLSHLLVKNTTETVAVNGVEKIEVMSGVSKIYEEWESAPVEYAKKLYRAMRAREKALQALEEINHKLLQAIKICQNASNKDHVQAPQVI